MLRPWSRTDWILAIAALALALLAVRPFYGLVVDDALISFRYAQNWVAGCGPVFNCGEPAVEGYTNFLWVAIAALMLQLGFGVIGAMQVLGLICGVLALWVAIRLAGRLFDHPYAGLPVALGLGSSPFWALNGAVGLETSAASLSVVLAVLLSLDLPHKRREAAGIAWAVSYLIRPEAAAFAFITGLYLLARGFFARSWWQTIIGGLRYSVAFLLVAGSYFAWRMVYYQSLLPNTYHAKQGTLDKLLPHNFKLLAAHPIFWTAVCAGGFLGLLAGIIGRRSGKGIYVFVIAACSAGISLSVYNNWWMPGHRLYMTAALLLSVLSGGLLIVGLRSSFRVIRLVGPLLAATLMAVLWYSAWTQQKPISTAAEQHYARPGHQAERMGRKIRDMAEKGDWLIIRDAGFIPFYAGAKVRVLDMHDHSLNDRRIATRGWDLNYVWAHDPRFIVLASTTSYRLTLAHTNEALIHRHERFKNYRQLMKAPWHAARHYFLFERKATPKVSPSKSKTGPDPTSLMRVPSIWPKRSVDLLWSPRVVGATGRAATQNVSTRKTVPPIRRLLPMNGKLIPARGKLVPARGKQVPARGKQVPARGVEEPATRKSRWKTRRASPRVKSRIRKRQR